MKRTTNDPNSPPIPILTSGQSPRPPIPHKTHLIAGAFLLTCAGGYYYYSRSLKGKVSLLSQPLSPPLPMPKPPTPPKASLPPKELTPPTPSASPGAPTPNDLGLSDHLTKGVSPSPETVAREIKECIQLNNPCQKTFVLKNSGGQLELTLTIKEDRSIAFAGDISCAPHAEKQLQDLRQWATNILRKELATARRPSANTPTPPG